MIRLRVGALVPMVVLAIVAATPAVSQEVRFIPRPDRTHERRLDEFLERGGWELWVRDTVLAPGARVPGELLVLEGAARIAGEVAGDVFVVDGDLFLRPGSRIAGDVVVLGGGFYASDLATVEGRTEYRPNDLYRVAPRDGGWEIYPVEHEPSAARLHGLYGFHVPRYQRVNEWTFGWGAELRAVELAWQPSLDVEARFHTEQESFEGSVRQYWYPTGDLSVGLEAERATRTNEAWIRDEFSNSLSYLFVGEDFRDWYEADRAAFVARRSRHAQWSPELTLQWEEARSLAATPQTVLFGEDDVRSNPAVDEGDLWSAALALTLRRRSATTRLAASVAIEAADSTVAGEFSFLLGEAQVEWVGPALPGHDLEVYALARGDLAGDLPRQRWTAFGGRGTLPTFPVLGLRGPRAIYAQITYLVPLAALDLGLLGTPELFLRDALGAAWDEGESPVFETNLMAGIRLLVLEAGIALDPRAEDLDPAFLASVKLPGDL